MCPYGPRKPKPQTVLDSDSHSLTLHPSVHKRTAAVTLTALIGGVCVYVNWLFWPHIAANLSIFSSYFVLYRLSSLSRYFAFGKVFSL